MTGWLLWISFLQIVSLKSSYISWNFNESMLSINQRPWRSMLQENRVNVLKQGGAWSVLGKKRERPIRQRRTGYEGMGIGWEKVNTRALGNWKGNGHNTKCWCANSRHFSWGLKCLLKAMVLKFNIYQNPLARLQKTQIAMFQPQSFWFSGSELNSENMQS